MLLFSLHNVAQNPFTHWMDAMDVRYSSRQPVIHYVLAIDMNDISFINMDMRISNIPDTFNVAMVARPEYDDEYWRFVEDFMRKQQMEEGK